MGCGWTAPKCHVQQGEHLRDGRYDQDRSIAGVGYFDEVSHDDCVS